MEQKTFLVTGASKGIGLQLSLSLAESGFSVILLARDTNLLEESTEQVRSISPASSSIICDLSDNNSIDDAILLLKRDHKKLDGIIHNAGMISPIMPMSKAPSDAWAENIQVNLIGVQRLTQGVYSLMKASTRCRVTTISSGASLRPIESWSSYCVAKAGQDMWARCLAEEGKRHGISAISIAPGIVDTDMQKEIRSADSQNFPSLSSFVGYFENGDLSRPSDVAKKLLPLITTHTFEQSGQRFDVREL
ncbi:MAG: SDR family NAD(P)-dependent oxidoreductase [Candidatus Poseidoniaceae archaeon]